MLLMCVNFAKNILCSIHIASRDKTLWDWKEHLMKLNNAQDVGRLRWMLSWIELSCHKKVRKRKSSLLLLSLKLPISLLYTFFSGYLDGVNYENYAYENANLLNPSISEGLSLTGLGAEAGYTADLIKQGGFALLRDLVSSLFAPKKSENIVLLDDRFAPKNSNLEWMT